jgi:ATP-dependent helicase/nuclease subunit B
VLQPNRAEIEILEATERGATVICANERCRRRLLKLFDATRGERKAWLSPNIITFEGFVSRLWDESAFSPAANAPALLNGAQETALWEQVLQRDAVDASRATRAAAQTADAWQQLHRYCAEGEPQLKGTPLGRLGREFEKRCAQLHVTHKTSVAKRGRAFMESMSLPAPRAATWVGFDVLLPIHRMIFDALKERGCACETTDLHLGVDHQLVRYEFRDTHDEVTAAARWARSVLEQEPGAEIGIVIPGLQSVRMEIERAFLEEVEPETLLGAGAQRVQSFEMSLGMPLAEWPMVRAALDLLHWARGSLSIADAGALLRGPFLSAGLRERDRRALLDREIRSRSGIEVTAAEVRRAATAKDGGGEPRRFACPELAPALFAIERFDAAAKNASAWAEQFNALLKSCGWPGERALNSVEYQLVSRWRELLRAFASLDLVCGRLQCDEAIDRLSRLADSTQFQAQNTNAPIQIVGHLEASGERFTHLWVLGLHQEAWPAWSSVNPLIPTAVALKHRMPGASTQEDYAFATRVTNRLLASAEHVVVSSPKTEKEAVLSPSTLIAEIPAKEFALQSSWIRGMGAVTATESLDEDRVPLQSGTQQSGGSAVFQWQAECPFKAFVRARLDADEIREPEDGIDAARRGTLVHRTLRRLWAELQSKGTLTVLREEQRRELVLRCAQEAVAKELSGCDDVWKQAIGMLEQGRIVELVMDWLRIEESRANFHVVEADSTKKEVEFGGLRVHVQRDRMDALDDGRLVVIDYKTGEVKGASWNGDRPDNPQLPIYAASVEGEVAAVLFAQVRTGDLKFVGECAESEIVPGVKGSGREQMNEQVAAWRGVLANLGEEFRTGEAWLDPKKRNTCHDCECKPVCRVREMRVGAGE